MCEIQVGINSTGVFSVIEHSPEFKNYAYVVEAIFEAHVLEWRLRVDRAANVLLQCLQGWGLRPS